MGHVNEGGEQLPLLRSFTATVNYENTDLLQSVDVNIKPITFLLSYQDFKMTMGILDALKPPEQEEPVVPEPSADSKEQKPKEEKAVAVVPATVKKETATLHCSCIIFSLINDYQGRNIPLTEFRIQSVQLKATDWSADVT